MHPSPTQVEQWVPALEAKQHVKSIAQGIFMAMKNTAKNQNGLGPDAHRVAAPMAKRTFGLAQRLDNH